MRFGAAFLAARCCSSARRGKRSTILARDLAAEAGATFGLHRFSLRQLAASIATVDLARRGLAPASGLAMEAVAAHATFEESKHEALDYLQPIADFRSFGRTLAATLRDLRHADTDVDQARPARPERPGRRAARAALRPASRRRWARGRRRALIAPRQGSCGKAPEASGARRSTVCSSCSTSPSPTRRRSTSWRRSPGGPERDAGDRAGGRRSDARGAATPAGGGGDHGPGVRAGPRIRWIASGASCSRPTIRRPPAPRRTRRPSPSSRLPARGARRSRSPAPSWRKRPAACPSNRMAVLLRSPGVYAGLLETALDRAGIGSCVRQGHPRSRSCRARIPGAACLCRGAPLGRRFSEYLSLGQVPRLDAGGGPPGDRGRWVPPDSAPEATPGPAQASLFRPPRGTRGRRGRAGAGAARRRRRARPRGNASRAGPLGAVAGRIRRSSAAGIAGSGG